MDLNTTFHDRWLADHLVASTTLDANHWILFDSGASANCCPKDFGSEWPLLPLNGEPPPLRSISGQPLHTSCLRPSVVRMTLDGFPRCFHVICDVPYPVISVARLLLQGYKVNMNSPDTCALTTPDGQEARIVRHKSWFTFVSLSPRDSFNEYDFAPLCNEFHAQFNSETPPGFMAAFKPVYYHADRWILKVNMLIRLHPRARKTLFVPNGTKDRPIPVGDLANQRTTEMEFEDGTKRTFTDN